MPNRRDTTRTYTCVLCGQPFHPWISTNAADGVAKYCSARCRALARVAAFNGVTLPSEPPPIRPESLPESGAPVLQSAPPTATAEELGGEWRESGEHWQRVTEWIIARREIQRRRASQAEDATWSSYRTMANEGRAIVLGGFGAGLFVKNGQLVVKQGATYSTQPDTGETLARGLHDVSAIVWLTNGGAGSLSIEALKWCTSQAITVNILTDRGEVLAVIHPSPEASASLGVPGRGIRQSGRAGRPDVVLRRAQYALASSGRDVEIARALMRRKIAAQLRTVEQHPELPDRERALAATSLALDWLNVEPPTPLLATITGLRVMEARAARGYFAGWVGLPLRVDAGARKRWPAPWLTVAERNSPLTRWHTPRNATNPAQAMLNFCYGLLESQVRSSLNVIGADVTCGIMHADDANRDSLVYDAMEPLRGPVDDLLLLFWQQHVFSAGDFQADKNGALRVHPGLRRVLVDLCRLPQRRVDDEARWLRQSLLGGLGNTRHVVDEAHVTTPTNETEEADEAE